ELGVEARQLLLLTLELEQRARQLAVLLPELGEVALGDLGSAGHDRVTNLSGPLRADDGSIARQGTCERDGIRLVGSLSEALEQPLCADSPVAAVGDGSLTFFGFLREMRARDAYHELLGKCMARDLQLDQHLDVVAERRTDELRQGRRDANLVVMLEAEQSRDVTGRLPHRYGFALVRQLRCEQRSHGLTTTAATSSLPLAKSRYSRPATSPGCRSHIRPSSAGCQRALIPSLCMTSTLSGANG